MSRTTDIIALSAIDVASLLAVLTPIVAVPMAVITFYLRALRDHLTAGRGDILRRIEHAETALRRLESAHADLRRDHVTKEDWLRESMLARRNIERLTTAFARIDAADTSAKTLTPTARRPVSPAHPACDRRTALDPRTATPAAPAPDNPHRPDHDVPYEGTD